MWLLGVQVDWFEPEKLTRSQPVHLTSLEILLFFPSCLIKKWMSSIIIISRKFASFRKLSRKCNLWNMSLWTKWVGKRVEEEGDLSAIAKAKAQSEWCSPRHLGGQKQPSNSLSLQQWVEKNQLLSDVSEESFFHSILPLLVLKWMKRFYSRLPASQAETSKQSSCQFKEILAFLTGVLLCPVSRAQREKGTQKLSRDRFKDGMGAAERRM